MSYLQKRAYAGMVARGGESLVTSLSYVNQSDKNLNYGTFVAIAENGCKEIENESDHVLGVILAIGYTKEIKPLSLVSVMSIPVGAEVWVLKDDDSEFEEHEKIKIGIGGKASKTGIQTNYYVVDNFDNLVKIMRSEV